MNLIPLFVAVLIWAAVPSSVQAQPSILNTTLGVNNDSFILLSSGEQFILPVLDNDSAGINRPLVLTGITSQPTQGSCGVDNSGNLSEVTWQASPTNQDFIGETSCMYQACDSAEPPNCGVAKVTINTKPVIAVNDPDPSDPSKGGFVLNEDEEFTVIDVLANDDRAPANRTLVVDSVSRSAGRGSCSIESNQVRYDRLATNISDDNVAGCEYTACTVPQGTEAMRFCDTAIVSFFVVPRPGDAPGPTPAPLPATDIRDDFFVIVNDERVNDGVAVLDVLENDVLNPFYDQFRVLSVNGEGSPDVFRTNEESPSLSGSCSITEDRLRVRYTPDPGFAGDDSCTYVACALRVAKRFVREPSGIFADCRGAKITLRVIDPMMFMPSMAPSASPTMSNVPTPHPTPYETKDSTPATHKPAPAYVVPLTNYATPPVPKPTDNPEHYYPTDDVHLQHYETTDDPIYPEPYIPKNTHTEMQPYNYGDTGNSYQGSGRFYVRNFFIEGKHFNDQFCVRDCAVGGPANSNQGVQCGGIVTAAWVELFGSVEECCSSKLSWMDMKQCVAKSTGVDHYSNDWYVDWSKNLCLQDCAPEYGPPCGGNPKDPWDQSFPTARECCEARLSWINTDYCVGESTGQASYPSSAYYSAPEYYTTPTHEASSPYAQSRNHGRKLRARAMPAGV